MKKSFITILLFALICYANADSKNNSKDKIVESISLNNVSVKEAARLMAITTGKPIVVSNDASKVLIDVHLQNIPVELAIKSICQSAGLWYQKGESDGLLHIMTMDEFKNSLQFSYEEKVEVVQILYPSAKDIGDALAKLYINRVIWINPKDSSGDRAAEISRALKRMDLLSDRGAFDMLETSSTSNSDVEEDDDDNTDTYSKKANDLGQFDTNKIKDSSIQQLNNKSQLRYHELSHKPGTVFISALPENNSLMLRSSDSSAITQIIDVIKKLDRPNPQVLLEVKILSVLLNDQHERAVDFLFGSNNGNTSAGFANGLLSTNGGQDILEASKNLVPQGSGIDSSAAIFSTVSKNFSARVQLLEKDNRVTQLATPNLIVSDNESSAIFIGTETTVMEKSQSTTTYTEVSSGVFQPNVSWEIDAPRRTIGTSLLLTPKIHADNTVTLRLLQEKSSLGESVQNVFSGGVSGTETSSEYFTSQNIDLQRLVTTVVGKDKDFMVIGGLIYEEVGKESEKIPGLSEIPIIGDLLFTRINATRQRKELLIIIRPFIMLAPGESQMISQSYLERISQHPVAKEDLPSLGVNTPNELAKPRVIDKHDPWLIQMFNKINSWDVSDESSFNSDTQLNKDKRRQNYKGAISEINTIINKEENSKNNGDK